jgi:hypothetical protein
MHSTYIHEARLKKTETQPSDDDNKSILFEKEWGSGHLSFLHCINGKTHSRSCMSSFCEINFVIAAREMLLEKLLESNESSKPLLIFHHHFK